MLRDAVINSLLQVSDVLDEVQALDKDVALKFYCDNNAGKHVRHVLDHFLAFLPAHKEGVLDYNTRNRDSIVEKDWQEAKTQLNDIVEILKTLPVDEKNLKIISEIDVCDSKSDTFSSNTSRELLYLINHTMHHAAYIKLVAKGCGITLPDHIGIAPSTASYLRDIEK